MEKEFKGNIELKTELSNDLFDLKFDSELGYKITPKTSKKVYSKKDVQELVSFLSRSLVDDVRKQVWEVSENLLQEIESHISKVETQLPWSMRRGPSLVINFIIGLLAGFGFMIILDNIITTLKIYL